MGGMVIPPIMMQRSAVRVERVENAVLSLVALADDEEVHFGLRVVEETMGDPGAGRKSDGVAGLQPMQVAIEPDVG
jgi:hypothetical protein